MIAATAGSDVTPKPSQPEEAMETETEEKEKTPNQEVQDEKVEPGKFYHLRSKEMQISLISFFRIQKYFHTFCLKSVNPLLLLA